VRQGWDYQQWTKFGSQGRKLSYHNVAFVYIYFVLWVLHVLYFAQHYVMLGLVLIVGLIGGGFASRLIRMAVLSSTRTASALTHDECNRSTALRTNV
jgi:hypothetical protein